ncbi:MAG: hypothetical protein WBO46_07475, partial [Caldilineaceae bacterium]
SSNLPGTGDAVSNNVDFTPWLGADVEDVASQTVNNGDTVSTSDGSVSATYAGLGSPTVTVAKYTGNPGSTSTAIGTGGSYVDVNLSGNFDPNNDTLTVDFTFGDSNIAGDPLYWFDGTNWLGVVDNNGNVPLANGSGNYSGVVFGPDSSPTLAQLNGTSFTPGASQIRLRRLNDTDPIAASETFEVVVEAASPALFGVDVSLSFDGSMLDVTKVVLGGGLDADSIPVNSVDDGAGTIDFAFSQVGTGKSNVSGTDLLLATITFYAEQSTTGTNIGLVNAMFSDNNGNDVDSVATPPAIPTLEILDSPLTVVVNPSPTVEMTVDLQGRDISNNVGYVSLELRPQTGIVRTDENGNDAAGLLQIVNVPAGTAGTLYNVRVDAPKYLAAKRTITINPGDTVEYLSATELELRGGDINNDDKINIQDLVLIGVNFDTGTASADINGDGTVNIQDLAIAAGNFSLTTDTAYTGYTGW